MDEAVKKVNSIYSGYGNYSAKVIHILFHWNTHSFFTFHQDDDGEVTVMVNLSYGKADMRVAGYENAEYSAIGAAHAFASKLFHRSGTAPRRCVKVAFFFKLVEGDIVNDDEEPVNKAGGSSDAPVKKEKQEEEGEAEAPSFSSCE